jgi:predicted 3-demethylubiquinone-9 3-methyltransferase (glyoxalase superfamily)
VNADLLDDGMDLSDYVSRSAASSPVGPVGIRLRSSKLARKSLWFRKKPSTALSKTTTLTWSSSSMADTISLNSWTNCGPRHNEAFSFQIATDNQQETDRYWNAIVGNGGKESQCGWCRDRWGLSWQITPRVLTEALAAGGGEAKRAFEAMMPMKKIDIATIEAARRG